MNLFHHQPKDSTVTQLQFQLDAVRRKDPQVIAILTEACDGDLATMSEQDKLRFLEDKLQASIKYVSDEPHTVSEIFHSRDPIGGLIQSIMNDHVIAQMQATGEGNPVVWIPAGIKGILEHFQGKYPFQQASAVSRIEFPPECKIALLADWGADNEHAKRIGDLAIARGAEYVIHLGDIYYSGSKSECETFIKNWPLKMKVEIQSRIRVLH